MVKGNELNFLMCQLSDHGCVDGFCCYNKINSDLFLNNCNLRHSGFACRSGLKRINPEIVLKQIVVDLVVGTHQKCIRSVQHTRLGKLKKYI